MGLEGPFRLIWEHVTVAIQFQRVRDCARDEARCTTACIEYPHIKPFQFIKIADEVAIGVEEQRVRHGGVGVHCRRLTLSCVVTYLFPNRVHEAVPFLVV